MSTEKHKLLRINLIIHYLNISIYCYFKTPPPHIMKVKIVDLLHYI